MRSLISTVICSLGIVTMCVAQENSDIAAIARTEKLSMLKDYAHKDVAGYQQRLNDFAVRCAQLSRHDKAKVEPALHEEFYLMADLLAVKVDKGNALSYLLASQYYRYDYLMQDKELESLKNEPQFMAFADSAKKLPVEKSIESVVPDSVYDRIMFQVKDHYNAGNADKINVLSGDRKKRLVAAKELASYKEEFGAIKSYKYLGRDFHSSDALYEIVADNAVFVLRILLDAKLHVTSLKFDVSSVYIDKLLAHELQ